MKLVVMIPAFNEESTIAKVIDEIPKKIKGISEIQVLVINDGSRDNTAKKAREKGAEVITHTTNCGLAKTFQDGLNYAVLEMHADIVVNTDADLQYNQQQIPELVQPILEKRADIVLGSRFAGWIEEMPLQKKWGNRLATWAVSMVSGVKISDGQTGFRSFTREAALRLNVLSTYTYTQETILQAARHKLKMVEIPIDFRKRADHSRLISSVWGYARRSILTLLMGYLSYKPLKAFLAMGGIISLLGVGTGMFVLHHFWLTGMVTPHVPAAILASVLILFGAQIMFLGLIAETIKQSRSIQEEVLYHEKKAMLALSTKKKGGTE
ncbi:MAG: glycosyltransferase family 2 protein [Candidatus Iainarchaeum archaeon]|uniref:Glycosyltransferase family 2 protein n=1 Tax=Candidatus Iainarchaeum sp. TaxID=3101447 RepID=A0A7T9DKT7_9ARCH|nr:MAG: glycosyltransferase family 2 protein [Candidatus Diapherotrites archaeon]